MIQALPSGGLHSVRKTTNKHVKNKYILKVNRANPSDSEQCYEAKEHITLAAQLEITSLHRRAREDFSEAVLLS